MLSGAAAAADRDVGAVFECLGGRANEAGDVHNVHQVAVNGGHLA